MRTRDILRQAKRDGREAGINAASWVFDGNTPRASYARVLKGLDEGDPAVLDSINAPNLSGEWADSPTPVSLASDYGLDDKRDPDGLICEEACEAWENAASDSFWSEIEKECRRQLKD